MIDNKYEEQVFLNKGGYATVYRVRLKDDETDYALKRFHSNLLSNPIQLENINREISIIQHLNHPNIIRFHKTVQEGDGIALLLEYAPGGSLFDLLQIYGRVSQRKVVMYSDKLHRYIRDVVEALKYLHYRDQPILHRDIKPENILLDEHDRCKLADFGSANFLDGLSQRRSYVGTQQYMAPEIHSSEPQLQSIDLWCLGVLIYELLVGKTPEVSENNQIEVPAFISRSAEDVIKKLLVTGIEERMSLKQLENHPWMVSEEYQFQSEPHPQLKVNKIKAISNKLKAKIIENTCKIKNNNENTKKQQVPTINKVNLTQHCNKYLINLQTKNRLKLLNTTLKNKIAFEMQRRQQQRPYLLQQISRVKRKISQFQKNISILQVTPIKFHEKCIQLISRLDRKLKELHEYVLALPFRIQSDVLPLPDIEVQPQQLPLSEYIFKWKMIMLVARRDALVELKVIGQRVKEMYELTMMEEGRWDQQTVSI